MATIRYAAYGSNLAPARLQYRVGAIEVLGTAELPGWQLDFSKRGSDDSGKCDLKRQDDASAHVAIYEFSVVAREALDKIEGVGHGYRLAWIDIELFGRCCIYLAESSHVDYTLQPYDWYQALVVSGARHHDFPDTYIGTIESVEARRDPDEARRAHNLAQCPPPANDKG